MSLDREDFVPPRAQTRNHRLALNRLWRVLPESAQQETLQTLARMLAQQVEQFSGRKEVPHERS